MSEVPFLRDETPFHFYVRHTTRPMAQNSAGRVSDDGCSHSPQNSCAPLPPKSLNLPLDPSAHPLACPQCRREHGVFLTLVISCFSFSSFLELVELAAGAAVITRLASSPFPPFPCSQGSELGEVRTLSHVRWSRFQPWGTAQVLPLSCLTICLAA